ncbi:MFS transporter [Pseudactinotalea sp. HY158]|uniref:MFS transporter n=1 Tax=Pseudactinotalea sp. HY158 TaxID=2654547 RepID=UPI001E38CA6D
MGDDHDEGERAPSLSMNRGGVALMSTSHLVNDFYQGVVPALLPFLAAERHYSYAAIAGLTLAATLISSVAQPVFGVLGDRRPRRWLIGAGMLTAGVGLALVGLAHSYPLTWILIAISGFGIAAFHPEAARAARLAGGPSNRAMSIFALGGNGGYALGSLVATPVFLLLGVRGTPLLLIPAAVMATILALRLRRVLDGRSGRRRAAAMPTGRDDWPEFVKLIVVVVIRSILFLGITSFIGLYFIRELHTSESVGGAALTVFLVTGAAGTLLGGWVADRSNRLMSIQAGFVLTVPALAGLVFTRSWPATLAFVALTGIALYLPFAVFIMLGQDYLPNRIGTASGVTVGLGVSVGGLFSPLLGTFADHTSLRVMFTALIVLPVLGLALTWFMRDPSGPGTRARPRSGRPVPRA